MIGEKKEHGNRAGIISWSKNFAPPQISQIALQLRISRYVGWYYPPRRLVGFWSWE